MGSFATATWGKIRLAAPVTALGCLTATLYARDLNVMLAGETDARTLGLDVRRTRALALLLSTLMTAVVVSMTGVIGFVGLMVPHVARLLVARIIAAVARVRADGRHLSHVHGHAGPLAVFQRNPRGRAHLAGGRAVLPVHAAQIARRAAPARRRRAKA